jgi:hypothetical protein
MIFVTACHKLALSPYYRTLGTLLKNGPKPEFRAVPSASGGGLVTCVLVHADVRLRRRTDAPLVLCVFHTDIR